MFAGNTNAQTTACIDSSLVNPNCFCPMIYDPVCGCNGVLYSNDCLAQCDGVTSWTSAIGPNGTILPCSVSPNCNFVLDIQTSSPTSPSASDGVITINVVSGGTAPYTVDNWSNNGNPISVFFPTNTMTGAAGVYCATVYDSNGCDTTICDSISFSPNTGPCTLTGASVYVGGAMMNASVNGMSMYDFIWSNGATGSQTQFYQGWCVEIVDLITGCDTTICDSSFFPCGNLGATVTANPAGQLICANATGGLPPYSYMWTFPNGTVSTGNCAMNMPGWCLQIIDSYGCDTVFCDTNVVSGNCYIDSVFASVGPCDSLGYVYVDISFASANTGSQGFQIMGNGVNYGTFQYGQSSYSVGPILADGTTIYEFLVQDIASPNCASYYTAGLINCGTSMSCDASFYASNLSATQVQFVNLSTPLTAPSGYIVEFDIDYGDGYVDYNVGSTSTHTYAQSGMYVACIEMWLTEANTGNLVCSDVSCDTIFVGNSPGNCQASFYTMADTTGNVNPLTTLFIDTSIPMGQIMSWNWDFGDGGTSTAQFPIYTYSAPGSYVVCLTIVASNWGQTCTSYSCDTIYAPIGGTSTITGLERTSFIYPNPTKDNVFVGLHNPSGKAIVSLYDTKGSLLTQKNLEATSDVVKLSLAEFQKGIYFIKVDNDGIIEQHRLVIIE